MTNDRCLEYPALQAEIGSLESQLESLLDALGVDDVGEALAEIARLKQAESIATMKRIAEACTQADIDGDVLAAGMR